MKIYVGIITLCYLITLCKCINCPRSYYISQVRWQLMKSILTCTLPKLYIAHIFCCMRKYYPELTVANWKHRYGKEGIFNSNNFGCSAWENCADCLRWWIFTVSTGFKLGTKSLPLLQTLFWKTAVGEPQLGKHH